MAVQRKQAKFAIITVFSSHPLLIHVLLKYQNLSKSIYQYKQYSVSVLFLLVSELRIDMYEIGGH